jgi:hypothetical protein
MTGGIERQIFEDSGRPEEADDVGLGPSNVDQAVDDAIRDLGRGEMPTAPVQARTPRDTTPPQSQPGLDGVDDKSNSGLLKALLDERDRRQDAARKLERYEQQEREAKSREQRPALSERLFSDPEGTIEELKREITAPLHQTIAQLQLDQDFSRAEGRHGERFQQAWGEWYETVKDGKDAATYFAVMNSASPGEALVQWYNRATRDREVGDDLDAFRQRVIDEYLGQSGAAPPLPRSSNGQFQPRPQAQRMPTSISRMGSSGNPSDDDDTNDGSDAAIFAAARPKHRRER